ncbi:GMC family oxidoreductase [Novosphingobium pentaromativorans]|uniref:Glucose-methanol-choline oxidoreductase N-terminal domain-containing protein n=1 Tax=Novosphingobium pentaromativorans US6-1 TaxID=1088721 RepID=G6EGH7_9SPHN|nr:GMC family oxidoreductase N-terminal domain-containing protein [Novosphingobium pentaromativorans]AIT82108.1 hypothetical protein JI59_21470 [Novosphingobium pentaromativorans US6-1]EHJ59628.1 hypothetical protein NSU_3511 [Novosphingobium pentaromativorans US6-1]
MTLQSDVIVIGAGAAGSTIAGRLASASPLRVLLLEAGRPADNPWIGVPAGLGRVLVDGRYNWTTTVDLGDRVHPVPHGRTLGGGTAINGLLYMRGTPGNFADWVQRGARGWDWDTVLDAYRRMESHTDGDSAIHGGSGQLDVNRLAYVHPSARAFISAAARLGARVADDLNDAGDDDKVGLLQLNTRRGRRLSAYDAFVRPALRKGSLRVETNAHVERILFEGNRAVGVVYRHQGQPIEARAREIVVSAGAILSPALLLRSGIGPAGELVGLGIDPVADLPGVGRNLQDHLYLWCNAQAQRRASMNRDMEGLPLLFQGLRYLLTRTGPIATGGSQAAALLRSAPDLPAPDLQMSFRPFTVVPNAKGALVTGPGNGITITPTLLSPQARGSVKLAGPDPDAAPKVSLPLGNRADEDRLLFGMRWALECFTTGELAALTPGPVTPPAQADDDALRAFIRETVFPGSHHVGTCAMGEGPLAVVDPALRVRAVEGLRVCDASVMPSLPSGNTSAPSMMIGFRGAELVHEALGG